jgi:A/G-specific adenine glycosylase
MQVPKEKYSFFRRALLNWYDPSNRPLPWKAEKDPYLIWLSEIILQQTRVEQGLPYYEIFRQAYPTVWDLAKAPQDEVMKNWEGLGYYSRARNMHEAARYIVRELGGQFPNTYEGLLKLKGVGPYTAAAVASFAYSLPHAVLDGNVFRVLSRYLGADHAIDSTSGKHFFSAQAQKMLDVNDPGRYNQAIMDFGATVCKPQSPICKTCPLKTKCLAYVHRRVDRLPVKSKKIERRQRYFQFLLFNAEDHIYIRKRTDKDIWRNLYEFPLIETEQPLSDFSSLKELPNWNKWLVSGDGILLKQRSRPFQQTLTHQIIHATFWEFVLPAPGSIHQNNFLFVERKNLSNFAFPKIVDWYLGDKSLYLNLH